LFLFPIFFVFHGYTSNYDSVPVRDALLLVLEYLGIAVILCTAFWFVFRDIIKAALMATMILVIYFFFGNIIDLLKNSFPGGFIWRYRAILPLLLFLFLATFFWIKARERSLFDFTLYLNTMMFIFILADAAALLFKMPVVAKAKTFLPANDGFTICDSCRRPDIFLIIPDQYTGKSALKHVFHFDNSVFEDQLRQRGFHIVKESRSNYNFTPFSVASTLDMNYLSLPEGRQNFSTVNYSYGVIRNSRVLKFLSASGYRFYNCSVFDFEDQPAHKYTAFLPYGIKLITSQTFTGRIMDDFQNDIAEGKYGFKKLQKKLVYDNLQFNGRIIDLTVKIAGQKARAPKFVYTHLMIPHYPYYFDSEGHPMPVEKLTDRNKTNAGDYIQYLQYGNKKLLDLVDKILANSPSPPIIIVLSDHGFQHTGKNFDPAYDFINLNAIYFPNRNYGQFYDSISNVNQFRVIFNSYFDQRLPLLKDSTSNLKD